LEAARTRGRLQPPTRTADVHRGLSAGPLSPRRALDLSAPLRPLVDVAIVSPTCPNVYWGGEAVRSEAARFERVDGAVGVMVIAIVAAEA
jgi:hypothetical protein